MTPFELSCCADAYETRQEEARQQIILQAYLTAYLYRVEKMPTLQSLLDTGKQKHEEQAPSDSSLLDEIRRMNAAAGGTENWA